MSGSRARTGNSVSLFPFLAVLVCAMGALIFLLIVTTRRIRSEALARAVALREAEQPDEQTVRPVIVQPRLPMPMPPSLVERQSPPTPRPESEPEWIEPLPGVVELGQAQSLPVQPPPPTILTPPEPEPIWPAAIAQKPPRNNPNKKLEADLAKLQAAQKAWLEAVGKKQQALAGLRQQVDELTADLRKINSQVEALAIQRTADRETQLELKRSRTNLLGQLAKVERQLQEAEQQIAAAPTKFQVVPFDGLTGTNYRPILIECTAAGLRFLPEGVLLTEDDFDGFTIGKNPLLAGAKALSDYWSKVSVRSDGKEPMPYVLMIVRPSGAKYFAAKQMLEPLDRPFGYELVEENLPLEIPPADPLAVELCRNAVERVLKERAKLAQILADRSPPRIDQNPKYRVIRKPGGGFEVDYNPQGHPAEDEEFGSAFGQPGGDGRFGTPPPPSPVGNSRSGRFPSLGDAPNNGGSHLVTRLPGGSGTPGSTTPPGEASSSQNNLGGAKSPGENPPPAQQGDVAGGRRRDPREPNLLPEEILRRSQGQVPYNHPEGKGTPESTGTGPGGFGEEDSQNTARGSGNGSEAPPTRPEEASPGEAEIPEAALDPGTIGQRKMPGGLPDREPSANRRSGTDSRPNSSGQATGSASMQPVQPIPDEVALPTDPNQLPSSPQQSPGDVPHAGTTSRPQSGPPALPGEPPMPNFLSLNSRRSINRLEPYQRRWGLSSPRASIGFEREIAVRVEADRLVVGEAFQVSFDARTTRDQLSAGMLEAVERKVRTWGRPPMSFYWVPTIRFEVERAGLPVYRHVNETAKAWGLETHAEAIED